MEYRHLIKNYQHMNVRKHSFSNELGILAQGTVKIVKGMDTTFFIDYKYIPSELYK